MKNLFNVSPKGRTFASKFQIMELKPKILKISILVLFFIGMLLAISCKNKYDFSDIYSVDLDGEWGIPIVNDQYTAAELLDLMDMSNFSQSPDGMLQYTYQVNIDNAIMGSELLRLNRQSSTTSRREIDIPATGGLPISINSDFQINQVFFDNSNFQIEVAEIRDGYMDLHINHNLTHLDSIVLVCNQATNTSHQPFHLTLTGGVSDYSFDWSDYTFRTTSATPNSVDVHVYTYGYIDGSDSPQTCYIESTLSSRNMNLKYVQGKLSPQHLHVSKTIPARIFSSNFSGNVTLYSPTYHINVCNSFGVGLDFLVDSAGFIGASPFSPVMDAGNHLSCVAAPARYTTAETENSYTHGQVTYNSGHHSFLMSGDLTINPSGINGPSVFVDETSTISILGELIIPFHANIQYVRYSKLTGDIRDYLDFGRFDNATQAVKSLTIKGIFENGLPLNTDVQFYFVHVDGNSVTPIDSVLVTPRILPAAQTDPQGHVTTPTENSFTVTITGSRLENIIQHSNNTHLRFTLSTEGQAKVYASQYIKAALAIRAAYDTEDINLNTTE